jgi:ribosomal protein S6--L-glutamate ligase
MNIIILSRNPSLYSTDSLLRAARKRHHYVRVLDHMQCDIHIESSKPCILYKGQEINNVDAIIPRIGSSATTYGAAVIRQFESMGIFSTLNSDPLLRARDKLSCLQILAANGIGVPNRSYPIIISQFNLWYISAKTNCTNLKNELYKFHTAN